ncbi:Toxin A [Slackia heliotrinireducens]|uniref:Putative cell wall binding protein n=1 Tax=Slackia heliotrinireducens (strain ATCC 29202 / DSM 20476 / NCTC 11029 / RHS 1) TaxID=471855 RepID=C7N2W6_SLAHD|nr:cell wall-binding protein [Slackia heliotrinireducens]ACV21487.1 putative cell wall binding protein [Slackia heliotrinireducens DSM 20476]VEG98926.1 Toxin A [Slackia heliotrinireducens]
MSRASTRNSVRRFRLLLAFAMAVVFALGFGVAGCSSDGSDEGADEIAAPVQADYYGQWVVSSIESDGGGSGITNQEELESQKELGNDTVFTFNEDGSATLTLYGSDFEATWDYADSGESTVEVLGETFDMDVSGNTLTLTKDDTVFNCKRYGAAAPTISDERTSLADVKGYVGDRQSPELRPGWNESDGKRIYVNEDGSLPDGWMDVDGAKYCFVHGAPRTGLFLDGDYYYFTNEEGAMQTGWQDIDMDRYYFDQESGQALIGWQQLDGAWYAFDEQGRMHTQWYRISESEEYYMGDDGKMCTGWVDIEGSSYYFDANGKLQKDTWIGNNYVNESGQWVEGIKPLPDSGTVFVGGSGISSATVEGSTDRNALVKFKDGSGNEVAVFFVGKGETVTVSMPGGYYYMYVAYGGDQWYGEDSEYPFGDETTFSKDDEGADFSNYTWQYTLYTVSNGNLHMDSIGADEF